MATGVTVLRLTDEVMDAACLAGALSLLEERGAHSLRLDLGAIRLPTAAGLGGLVTLNRELRARGGRLVLINVPADTCEVLEVTHLAQLLDVRPLSVGEVTGYGIASSIQPPPSTREPS
jgi:anti-anti-sigma regulatory factor